MTQSEIGVHERIQNKIKEGSLRFTSNFALLSELDVVIITVGTPINSEGKYDLTSLEIVVDKILEFSKPEQLIILKSTLTPGTTSRLFSPIREQHPNTRICYCPERLAEGTAIDDLKNNPMVVSGFDTESVECCVEFLQAHLNVECEVLKTVEEAELLKLATNAWIDLNIAYANELAKLCAAHDIDTMSLIKHANYLKKGDSNVNILNPSIGVGGSCLTKDPIALCTEAESKNINFRLPQLARSINEETLSSMFYHSTITFKNLDSNRRILRLRFLGVSFKSNVADTRNSPVFNFIEHFKSLGYQVEAYDPFVIGTSFEANMELNSSIESVIKNARVLAFLCGHNEFANVTPELIMNLSNPNCIIFDGRVYFCEQKIREFKKEGHFIGQQQS